MPGGGFDVEVRHFCVGGAYSLGIAVLVQFAANGQTGLGGGGGNKIDTDEAAREQLAAPVLRDVAEKPALDLVALCALPRCTDVVGTNPTWQLSLHPKAPGADQEATNGLKHLGKRSLLGISGPYGPQHKPTPRRPRKDQCESQPASGTGRPPSSGKRARHAPDGLTGVKVAARMAEHQCATREVCPGDHGWYPDGQRRTREGQRRLEQMADGSVLPRTPGNAG